MKRIILDTDILNEMDDQFALVYLISKLYEKCDECKLEAITVAPFNPSLYLKIDNKTVAMQKSKEEIEKIQKMCGSNYPVYVGANCYMGETENYNYEAVDKIIEIVENSDEMVSVLCIACPTNIAMALKKAPHIAKKMEIIWLGGNGLDFPDNSEFNLMQDRVAVDVILQSDVKTTIIPARPVSSAIFLSKEVSEKYIKSCGEIGLYLNKLVFDFAKPRLGSGRRLWDVGVVYEFFNRDFALEKLKTEPYRSPIVYTEKVGVKLDENLNYAFNDGGKPTNFACYMDGEMIIDDLIKSVQFLNE